MAERAPDPERPARADDRPLGDAWMASPAVPVVAHELLGTIGNIRTLVQLLARRGDAVDAGERARLLMLVDQRAERVARVLGDLVRGFTPGAPTAAAGPEHAPAAGEDSP